MSKGQSDGEYPRSIPLIAVDEKELKSIKVAIRRNDLPGTSKVSPLRRRLESPEALKVHLTGDRGRLLFYREDVIANVHPVTDDQVYRKCDKSRFKDPKGGGSPPGNSKSGKAGSSSPKKLYQPGPLFGDYINGAPPFPLPPDEDPHYRRPKQDPVQFSEKVVFPSTSHDSHYKSRSRDDHRHSPSRRSRSPYEKQRYHEYERPHTSRSSSEGQHRCRERSKSPRYRKSTYHHKERCSPPLNPGEYRPPKRHSKSKSPERTTHRYSEKVYKKRDSPPHDDGRRGSYSKRRSRSVSQPRRYSRSPPRDKYREQKPRRNSRSPNSNRGHSSRELSPRERGKRPRTPPRSNVYRSKRSSSHERHRSRTPLRPGEFRPRKRSRSPPLRPGEYRPPKHRRSESEHHEVAPTYIYCDGSGFAPLMQPQFMNRFMQPRPMLRPGQIIIPPFQIISIPPQFPRPPLVRPPIIYNNRSIPRISSPPTSTASTSNSRREPEDKSLKAEHKPTDGNNSGASK